MKNLLLFLLLIFASITASAATKIAIIVDGPVDDSDKLVIESRVGAALSGSKTNYDILERTQEFLDILTKEQAYQISGEVAPEEICKFGERWGAKYVLGIYVTENRGTMVATAKLMDVTTGKKFATITNHKVVKTFDDITVFAQTLGVNIKREISKVL